MKYCVELSSQRVPLQFVQAGLQTSDLTRRLDIAVLCTGTAGIIEGYVRLALEDPLYRFVRLFTGVCKAPANHAYEDFPRTGYFLALSSCATVAFASIFALPSFSPVIFSLENPVGIGVIVLVVLFQPTTGVENLLAQDPAATTC